MAFTAQHYYWIVIEILCYLFLFVAICSGIFLILRSPMRQYKPTDLLIFKKLSFLHTPLNNRLMTAITLLGKHQFLIPANLVLIFLFIARQQAWYAFITAIVSLTSLLIMFLLKHLFRRNRPVDPLLNPAKGKSFPSGHAIMSVNFYGMLLYLLYQGGANGYLQWILSVAVIIMIIAIGFSRVYLQVHYTSDVLAGFIIGVCWLYCILHILERVSNMIR